MTPATADLVNGSFELIGAACNWTSVAIYARKRRVEGVFWPATLFYSGWGVWNLIYYPSLGQMLSLAGGTLLTSASITWVTWVAIDKWRARQTSNEE